MQYQINNEYEKKDCDTSKKEDSIDELSMDWGDLLGPIATTEVVHAETAGDGLIYSLQNMGRVDIAYISNITGLSKDDVLARLKGSIYQNPKTFTGDIYEGYVTSDEYLSGNLLTKLADARYANYKYNGYFNDNIDAILQVLPEGVSDKDIFFTISSPWIPDKVKEDFICNILGVTSAFGVFIKHDPITGKWEIPSHLHSQRANITYGTPRIGATKIVEHLLNMKPMAIYDTVKIDDKHKKQVLNKAETLLAEEKAKVVSNKFISFVNSSFEHKRAITEAYNSKYGYNVARCFNGSFLELKNINPSIQLFDYQKNAVARILLTPNTFLAHNVGCGKTYEMIAGGEELLRTGKSKKNLYVVPNSIVGEWGIAYKTLYPKSEVLVLDSKKFTKANRRAYLEQIRDTDVKAVIIPYSIFDSIPLSYNHLLKCLVAKLQEVDKTAAIDKQDTTSLKALQKSLKEKIDKLQAEGPTLDEDITMDKLGFTRLFVDEAHNYKNVPITTKMGLVRGINQEGSLKCQHMLDIVDFMNSDPYNGVIMASGTPITNSITDVYTIQRYLQHGELKLMDLDIFDSWAAMFAENDEVMEIDVDTSNYRVIKRFSRFHNLPELTKVLSNVCDFYFANDSKDVPDFKGYTDTLIKRDTELGVYLKDITERIEQIRNGYINSKEDNMLKVTMDGRKAALDLRLVDFDKYSHIKSGKLFACAENILNDYIKTTSFKGTQLVFSDISTPKDTFNVYDELKYMLVGFGIPADEIQFIHSAETDRQRTKLFEAVRNGDVRVLIGSTQKLGTGVNVQDRLYSIHHLSIPWRPSDMVQREGRIIRQGNTNPEVFIHRYITEGSFDAYSWQILETKQKFINELLNNSLTARSRDDIQDTVLTYAEVKALAIGNPLLKEHVEVKNELSRLNMLKNRTDTQMHLFEKELLEIPNKLEEYKMISQNLAIDSKNYADVKKTFEHDEILDLRKRFFTGLMDNLNLEEEKYLTSYQGFDFYIPANLLANALFIRIKGAGTYSVTIGNSEIGALQRIDNFLDGLDKKLEETRGHIKDLKERMLAIKERLSKRPDYSGDIDRLSERLKEIEKELGISE